MKTLSVVLFGLLFVGCLKTPPKGNYDLQCVYLTHTPRNVVAGDSVTFKYRVRNAGNDIIPSNTYKIELYVNGVLLSWDNDTRSLTPHGVGIEYTTSQVRSYAFRALKPGVVKFKLLLDPTNNLKEINEGNNIITGSFKVAER